MERIKYKLRAELVADIFLFIQTYKIYIFKIDKKDYFPDTELEFESELSLNDLIKKISLLPDCHVMVETLQPKDKYTGVRIETIVI